MAESLWPQPMDRQTEQLNESQQAPSEPSEALSSDMQRRSVNFASLHRARQAAEKARAVAAAVAIATAAAADRAASDRDSYGTLSEGLGASRERGQELGGSGSLRGAPQRLTERALLLHESRSAAGDAHRDITAARGPQRRGSRFVPDALPFHCAADYLSHAGPPIAAQQRT